MRPHWAPRSPTVDSTSATARLIPPLGPLWGTWEIPAQLLLLCSHDRGRTTGGHPWAPLGSHGGPMVPVACVSRGAREPQGCVPERMIFRRQTLHNLVATNTQPFGPQGAAREPQGTQGAQVGGIRPPAPPENRGGRGAPELPQILPGGLGGGAPQFSGGCGGTKPPRLGPLGPLGTPWAQPKVLGGTGRGGRELKWNLLPMGVDST